MSNRKNILWFMRVTRYGGCVLYIFRNVLIIQKRGAEIVNSEF